MSVTLEHAVPTGREEAWRFTPLERLHGLHADARIVPVALEWVATGCEVSTVDRDGLGDFAPIDRVAERAWLQTTQGTLVRVGREVTGASARIAVSVGEEPSFAHLRIVAEPFSEATVVIRHTGSGDFIGNIDAEIGDGARLTVVSEQMLASGSVHLGQHRARVGRDASYRHVAVTLSGDVVRLTPTVEYSAPGGSAEMLGVFLVGSGQHAEHRLLVEHTQPHCSSRVTYKGALDGEGTHSVWVGDVVVRHEAIGTDTYELNRNLLLSEGARADSVPNLELETGEIVGAGHASATGRFDDDQLFYLQSRGIPAEIARMLVVRGFFADVVLRVGDSELQSSLMAAVDSRLEDMGMRRFDEETP